MGFLIAILMSLTLKYHAKTSVPVEIEGIVPDRLRDKSVRGDRTTRNPPREPAGSLSRELFNVSGDPSDERIDLEGDLAGVHLIGSG